MFEAVCAARLATVNSTEVEDAAESRVREILHGATFVNETIAIILRFPGSMDEAIEDCIRHEEIRTGRLPRELYRTYQRHLHDALERQVARGRYDVVLDVPYEQPFVVTLKNITSEIRKLFSPPTLPLFPHLLGTVKVVIALAGLSECGKSTTATSLVLRHNSRSAKRLSILDLGCSGGAFRLKLVYLEGLASSRLGKSLYELDDTTRAVEIIHELDTFTRIHKYLEVITLESMHNFGVTRRLQELIGSSVPGREAPAGKLGNGKLVLVYLDTPLELRMARTNAQGGGAVFDPEKDLVKRSRGADQLKEVAEIVCKNEGTLEEACELIEREIGNALA